MELTHRQIYFYAPIVVAAGLLSGCVKSLPVQIGIVLPGDTKCGYIQRGDPVPEFSYRTMKGEVKKLSDLRGQVILLLFPDDPEWPDCERCKQFEQLASTLSCAYATVSVVSIAIPDKPCEDAICAMCQCKIKGDAQLVVLCDQTRWIQRLYGPNVAGKIFIIDSDGSMRGKGTFDDMAAIERTARIVVSSHVFDYYKTGFCYAEHQESPRVSASDFHGVHKWHAMGSESHPAD